jgi:hypothetical protein
LIVVDLDLPVYIAKQVQHIFDGATAMHASGWSSPSNVLDLAVLGVASERARSQRELLAAVRHLGGGRFQPTAEVVDGRIAALAEAALLVPLADPPAETRWRPSRAGHAHVQRLLLMRSGPPVDGLAALCACLKICFLELLDDSAQHAVLDDLLSAHRSALDEAEAALAGCPCRCRLVQRYLAHDVERWQAELGWLEGLSGLMGARADA